MVRKKSTSSKTAKATAIPRASSTKGNNTKAGVSNMAASAQAASATRNKKHTYANPPSQNSESYALIMKTVIPFLGLVLLLAILANIFVPSIERHPMIREGNIMEGASINRAYNAAAPETSTNDVTSSTPETSPAGRYRYIVPEGAVPAPQ